MPFNAINVIDGDTFEVSPHWRWSDQSGGIVRPTGYNAPEEGQPGYGEATTKLRDLIQGREVELRNPVNIDHGRLVCDVYINGENLANHFPEYQE